VTFEENYHKGLFLTPCFGAEAKDACLISTSIVQKYLDNTPVENWPQIKLPAKKAEN
jgi:hypothetical protein